MFNNSQHNIDISKQLKEDVVVIKELENETKRIPTSKEDKTIPFQTQPKINPNIQSEHPNIKFDRLPFKPKEKNCSCQKFWGMFFLISFYILLILLIVIKEKPSILYISTFLCYFIYLIVELASFHISF